MSALFMIVVAKPLIARVTYHDHGKALEGRARPVTAEFSGAGGASATGGGCVPRAGAGGRGNRA
jgi:hypothetical protein